jgi:hypothetical protein
MKTLFDLTQPINRADFSYKLGHCSALIASLADIDNIVLFFPLAISH